MKQNWALDAEFYRFTTMGFVVTSDYRYIMLVPIVRAASPILLKIGLVTRNRFHENIKCNKWVKLATNKNKIYNSNYTPIIKSILQNHVPRLISDSMFFKSIYTISIIKRRESRTLEHLCFTISSLRFLSHHRRNE